MRYRVALALVLTATLTTGCIPKPDNATSSRQETPAEERAGQCDALKVQKYVGQPFSAELANRMKAEAGAAVLRTGHINNPITMDYNRARLNIYYNDGKAIAQVDCG